MALRLVAGTDDAMPVADRRLDVEGFRQTSRERLRSLVQAQRRQASGRATATALDVHRALVDGLPGSALMTAGSLVYDTLDEVSRYFDTTPKTLRRMLRDPHLGAQASERAMRIARAVVAASDLLGNPELARRYLHARNFALGGATPLDLLETAVGERLVLDELQAMADGGPL